MSNLIIPTLLHLIALAFTFRLPTTITPLFYSLQISPKLTKEFFRGTVIIDIKIDDQPTKISLHSANLTINRVILDQHLADFILKRNSDILEIFKDKNKSEITKGHHRIKIDYIGIYDNDKQLGFSKSGFRINKTLHSPLLISDLEATSARMFYPCFDEPALKAKFKLTVIIPGGDDYFVLSNTKLQSKFKTRHGVHFKFHQTPLMSTYLLTVAVTRYKYVETRAHLGNRALPIRIYSHDLTAANKTLNYAAKAIKFLNNYLSHDYILDKIDLIEYERNYTTATENWGLVTFTQGLLDWGYLADYDHAETIAHEFAHFWFGNLVTNNWWDDIWLQESFAQYLSLKTVAAIYNTSFVEEHYSLSESYSINAALSIDEETPSEPIIKSVATPSEINAHFSDITYVKGGELLRMLEDILGERIFKNVLREYLRIFKFKSASTPDFLDIIDEFDSNAREFLESYLYQNRYPIITVDEDADNYILTQTSCNFKNKKTANEALYEHKWTIPIRYITSLEQTRPVLVWFEKDMDKLVIPKGNETWIKLNYRNVGYYRVKYSHRLQDLLLDAQNLDHKEKQYLILESFRLFKQDLIDCDVIFRYILNSFSTNGTKLYDLPLGISAIFYDIIDGAKKTINNNETVGIIKNFLKWLKANSNYDHIEIKYQRVSFDDNGNTTKMDKNENTSNKFERCLYWIRNNLESLVEDINKDTK